MGADSLFTIHQWVEFERLLSLCRLFVLPREEGERPAMLAAASELRAAYNASIELPNAPCFELSSTAVRKALLDGAETEMLLRPEVLAYIRQRQLYA